MRTEKDFIGEVTIPEEALYGIHSFRARENFPSGDRFPMEWFRATGTVKLACYRTVRKLLTALQKEHLDVIEQMLALLLERTPVYPNIDFTIGALTYLAAAVTSILQLLYYISIAKRRS